jgi:hypothetical protein
MRVRLPRLGSSKLISNWLLLTLAASIVVMIGGFWLYELAAFAPSRIWRGEVWRLVTWIFVEPGPWGLVLTCACIYKFGGELQPRWGDRRLRRFMIEIVLLASVTGAVAALFSEFAWNVHRCGGLLVQDVLVIAWARQYPRDTIVMFGFLRIGGRQLVAITLGITIVFAVAVGPFAFAPELVACLAAAFYPESRLARR